jgi:tellurite resistance protein TehA-like permease
MLANIIFLGCCWLFLLAVVATIALRAWRHREAEDAAETQQVMDSLGYDRSHAHEQDAVL